MPTSLLIIIKPILMSARIRLTYGLVSWIKYDDCGFFWSKVAERIVAGMFPMGFKLVESLHPNPDLYGPFWLSVTLILTTAISGNISNVLK